MKKYPDAAKQLLRDTVLDAAGALMRERPWAKVTMAEVARQAGVSRQTVYNEFGGRRELGQAYVLREGDRFIREVEAVIAAHAGEPRVALARAFETFLAAAEHNPLVAAIAGHEGGEELLALVTVHGGDLLAVATGRLAALLQRTWPQVTLTDARIVSDCLVRLAISHAALPGGPSADVADCAGFAVAVIAVPTPLRDGVPDVSYIESAAELIGPLVTKGSVDTSSPLGTDRMIKGAVVSALRSDAARRIRPIWDESIEGQARQAFLSSEKPYARDAWDRVEARMRGYRDRWMLLHREACEATRVRHEQPQSMMTLRTACLDTRLGQFSAAADVLAHADALIVEKAENVIASLPTLESCADLGALNAEAPGTS